MTRLRLPPRTGARRTLLYLVAALSSGCAAAASAQDKAAPVALTPTTLSVLSAPRILPGSDGRFHVVYELRIANATPLPVDIGGVEVLSRATGRATGRSAGRTVARLDAATVARRLAVGGDRGAMRTRLEAAQYGILFLHVSFATAAEVPAGLTHRVTVVFAPKPDGMAVTGGPTRVLRDPPPVLGPPLKGRNYVAADSCCDTIRHVRALLPINGAFRLAQRFAIDWEQIDDAGRIFVGAAKDVASYHIYGKAVLAVADGTVIHALDGLPNQTPGALPKGLPIEEADGNHIVLDIGGGAYVLYAHLKPGSVRAKLGQKVRKGELLGQVGNSGNSSEPHLHLHVMDGPSPLDSDGLPYVFESFLITGGNDAGTDDFDRAAAQGTPMKLTPVSPPTLHRRQLPLDLRIVQWTD